VASTVSLKTNVKNVNLSENELFKKPMEIIIEKRINFKATLQGIFMAPTQSILNKNLMFHFYCLISTQDRKTYFFEFIIRIRLSNPLT
jgi:hypothetical protein